MTVGHQRNVVAAATVVVRGGLCVGYESFPDGVYIHHLFSFYTTCISPWRTNTAASGAIRWDQRAIPLPKPCPTKGEASVLRQINLEEFVRRVVADTAKRVCCHWPATSNDVAMD